MNSSVLIISAVFPPEPIVSAKLSEDIANGLVEHDIKVIVLHPRPTRPYGFEFNITNRKAPLYEEVVLQTYVCPQSNFLGRLYESYSFGCQCQEYIMKHHQELSCIYANVWPFFAQLKIVRTAKKYNVPCLLHIQDIYPESFLNKISSSVLSSLFRRLLLPVDKYILSQADHVFAISANMKNILVKSRKIDSNKISIIENWQDETDFINYNEHKDILFEHKKWLTFMFLGNNGPVAGVEYLITCFAKANIEGARLVIAGSGSRKQACMELSKMYPNVQIEFWEVPDGKVPEIQELADVMVLPVRKGAAMSSIPSKLPAYMFSKKMILGILDTESDTAKAILNADCGVVVEPEGEELLIATLRNIVQWSESKRKQKGENGFEYALKRFSKRNNLSQIIKKISIYLQ